MGYFKPQDIDAYFYRTYNKPRKSGKREVWLAIAVRNFHLPYFELPSKADFRIHDKKFFK